MRVGCWRSARCLIEHLGGEWNLLVPDLPGHGRSAGQAYVSHHRPVGALTRFLEQLMKASADALAQAPPRSAAEVVEGCGHGIPLQRPQWLAERVRQWLRRGWPATEFRTSEEAGPNAGK